LLWLWAMGYESLDESLDRRVKGTIIFIYTLSNAILCLSGTLQHKFAMKGLRIFLSSLGKEA